MRSGQHRHELRGPQINGPPGFLGGRRGGRWVIWQRSAGGAHNGPPPKMAPGVQDLHLPTRSPPNHSPGPQRKTGRRRTDRGASRHRPPVQVHQMCADQGAPGGRLLGIHRVASNSHHLCHGIPIPAHLGAGLVLPPMPCGTRSLNGPAPAPDRQKGVVPPEELVPDIRLQLWGEAHVTAPPLSGHRSTGPDGFSSVLGHDQLATCRRPARKQREGKGAAGWPAA